MRLLVFPTAVASINFVADVLFMCTAAIGTVVAAAVLVPPYMHFLLVVGAATAVVVGVVATVAASDAGAVIVDVSMVAVVDGAVVAEFATWFLSDVVLSAPLFCQVQICPSPSVLSLSIHILLPFHLETFCASRACMRFCTCGPHHV